MTPSSVIGYSLGESAGLFAMKAWPERGEMLARMRRTDLFATQLADSCEAARKAWQIPLQDTFQWQAVAVNRPADMVQKVINDISHIRLLIINTPEECVIGGRKESVSAAIEILGCKAVYLEGVVTVHCDAAEPVAEKYRNLHVFPVTPPKNIKFYSCGFAKSYELSTETAADSILKQALSGFDFTQTIRQAYNDGIHIFLEMGPHASCTRMIRTILKDQPHLAISASLRGEPESLSILKFLSAMIAERLPVSLDWLYGNTFVCGVDVQIGADTQYQPPGQKWITVPIGGFFSDHMPMMPSKRYEKKVQTAVPGSINMDAPFVGLIDTLTKTTKMNADVHRKFLDFSEESGNVCARIFGLQTRILETMFQKETVGFVEKNLNSELLDNHQKDTVDRFQASSEPLVFDRNMCLEFAIGSVEKVLGPEFAEVDTYKARVRLPDEPLMLVDRILSVEGEKRSLGSGRVVTEHDVLPDAWYLDGGRAPVCISVEAGQADLFLCSYLGIDLAVKGERTYRLLDAVVEFHRGLPMPGDVIRYFIEVERFVRHGDTYLFFFNFEGYIDDALLITMQDGCAGFFTEEEIQNSGGIILKGEETAPIPGKKPDTPIINITFPSGPETYDEHQIEALRHGDLESCFGSQFKHLKPAKSLWLPGGRMKLIHRVLTLDPKGGRFGLGMIRAEADIHPDDWFLTCHFMDDMVMPGTLMYECCAHTLRILLQRIGWVTNKAGVCYEPVIGVKSRLKCRGPVTPKTRHVIYEVFLKEIGYNPEPYVIADALMKADGRAIVRFENMSMKMTNLSIEEIKAFWTQKTTPESLPAQIEKKPVLYGRDKILAFAAGKPSEAFGEPYKVFDHDRVIARLPRPPYSFMDRVTYIEPDPWILKPDGWIEAEYNMPPDAWYYRADGGIALPFCILLEIALQPCGWLAAYAGSALRSEKDLKFRNLGGTGMVVCEIFPENGPLNIRCRMKKVSEVEDMIIEHFDFILQQKGQIVYKGETHFGFFTVDALKQQVGIRNVETSDAYPLEKELSKNESYLLEVKAPYFPNDPDEKATPNTSLAMPSKALLMVDEIETYIPDGGPAGLGFIRGKKRVDPKEWFFKAHFYQDPVCPGSLGIESFIQLIKFIALKKWPLLKHTHRFGTMTNVCHTWIYRGQIIPENKTVSVDGWITQVQEDPFPTILADGRLKIDGLYIYKMESFGIILQPVG
jgi:3-hydroxymyristoyl/3-hydroxydecanoyl-(acyl carrier protein) dehydratase